MKKLKTKIILGLLSLQIIIFMALGFTIFQIMQKELVNKLRSYMLSVAQACAGAIDPIKHKSFINQDAKNDPEYGRYFRYLNTIYIREKNISSIFTLNYNSEKDSFHYAVDGAIAETDKIWMESNQIGFSVYINTMGLLTIRYDSIEHTNDFPIHIEQGIIKIGIINKGRIKKLLINEMEVIKVISEDPFIILSAGKEVHPLSRNLKIQMPLFDKNEIFTLSYSAKGEPSSEPGALYIVSESEKTKNLNIFKSGIDHVDENLEQTSYGNDFTATALIKDKSGNAAGMVIISMESKTFQESKEEFLATASWIFIVTFLFTLVIGYTFANYIIIPITILNRGVNDLTNGNLDKPIILKREDEFGELARSLNQMINKIKSQNGDGADSY